MDEGNDQQEREVQCDEQEEDLLAEDEENANINTEQDRLMATMTSMNEKMNSFLTRLSRVEAAHGKPAAKKRRLAASADNLADENNLSEAERGISDSEVLTDGTNNGEAPKVSNTSAAEDELLSEIAQDYAEETQTCDDVSQQLADIVNQRWSSKLDESKLKDKMDKYDRPRNCEKLIVPRVNPEIWSTLNHMVRGSDLKLVNFQKTLVKVGVALTQSTEALLSMRAKHCSSDAEHKQQLGKLVTYNTDTLAMLGHTHMELLSRRRELIKPNLNKEYVSLCSPQTPITQLLFGDDLQARMASIKAANKISQTTTSSSKFTPNTRRPFEGSKNRSAKGKSFTHSSYTNSKPFLWQSRSNNYRSYPQNKPKFQAGKRKNQQRLKLENFLIFHR